MSNVTSKNRLQYFYPEELTILGVDTDDNESCPLFSSRVRDPLDKSLVENIKLRGVLVPVGYTPTFRGLKNVVIDGNRRTLHARAANKKLQDEGEKLIKIPCFLHKSMRDLEMLFRKSTANNFRKEVDPLEQAREAVTLQDLGMSHEDICKTFGWSKGTLFNRLRLLKCPEEVQKAVAKGDISVSAAMSIYDLKVPEKQLEMLEELKSGEKENKQVSARKAATICQTQKKFPSRSLLRKIVDHPEGTSLSTDALYTLKWVLGLSPPVRVPGLNRIIKKIAPEAKSE